jgi:hypothetical protein
VSDPYLLYLANKNMLILKKTVLKSDSKIGEPGKIDTPNTHVHYCLLSWLDTVTSMKSGRVKLVVWV